MQGANDLGIPLPQTAFCQQLFNAAEAAGEGDLDHSAAVKALERLASHSLD
jgi:2-hydroxy-3-oxopropionate reductase